MPDQEARSAASPSRMKVAVIAFAAGYLTCALVVLAVIVKNAL